MYYNMYVVAIIFGIIRGLMKIAQNQNNGFVPKDSCDTNFFFYIAGNE